MDVSEERFFGSQTPDRSDTNSPRSQMSSPHSASSINVTDQAICMSQHQQNLETLNRMGMFFHAQQMHLNQSFDVVKSRLGLTQVPGMTQGPRHTIDAILGLNGSRQRVSSEFEQRREERECEPVPASPGAAESAGEWHPRPDGLFGSFRLELYALRRVLCIREFKYFCGVGTNLGLHQ